MAPRRRSGSCGRWRHGHPVSLGCGDGPTAVASVRRGWWSQAAVLPRARPDLSPPGCAAACAAGSGRFRLRSARGVPFLHLLQLGSPSRLRVYGVGALELPVLALAGVVPGDAVGHYFSGLLTCCGSAGRQVFGMQMAAMDAACSQRRVRPWAVRRSPCPAFNFGGHLSGGVASSMDLQWRSWMRLPPTREGRGLWGGCLSLSGGLLHRWCSCCSCSECPLMCLCLAVPSVLAGGAQVSWRYPASRDLSNVPHGTGGAAA